MARTLVALLSLLAFGLFACTRRSAEGPRLPESGRRVFVVCEGAYGSGNSALTVYYPDSGLVIPDAYSQANNRSLGDVFQSMTALPGSNQFLLCVNNSDRVSFLEKTSLKETGALTLPKPRYALALSGSKAYVSSLYGNKVYLINPQKLRIEKSIELPFKNPEGMLLAQGKVWVAPWDTAATHIYAIDTAQDAICDSLRISGAGPQEILEDAQGMFWVLSGNDAQGVESRLTRLNPNTGAVLGSFSFGSAVALKPCFNAAKDTLYFLEVAYNGGSTHNGVYRMHMSDAALPQQAFVAAQGLQYFWGLGLDPHSGNVYVADPKGFTQKGSVRVYRSDGQALDSFAAGVGPGHFYFEP